MVRATSIYHMKSTAAWCTTCYMWHECQGRKCNTTFERVLGRHWYGTINDNGERFVEMCHNNNLVIGNTIFPHKDIHKLTWKSPDGRTINQIDYITINGKWRRSLRDVRVYRGADINSDHYLVVSKVKLKLRKNKIKQQTKKLDIPKLKSPNIARQFQLELRNRFGLPESVEENVNRKWEHKRNICWNSKKDAR